MDSDKIRQLMAIGCAESRARKLLSEHDGDIAAAIAVYKAASTSSTKKIPNSSSSGPRIMTLGQMASASGNKKKQAQNFYAGGEKSGMMVEGGPAESDEEEANASLGEMGLIHEILKKAGKRPVEPDSGKKAFRGIPQSLADDGDTAETLSPMAQTENPNELQPSVHTLSFWRNGFTFDHHAPLYSYADPSSQQLLRVINTGGVPIDFLKDKRGQPVDVHVEQRMSEEYAEKSEKRVFMGLGNRLGDMAPESATTSVATSTLAKTPARTITAASSIDNNQPTTTLQLRMADGTRQIVAFNQDSSIAQLYSYIREHFAITRPFQLLAGHPPTVLPSNDDTLTLEKAGLLNSVVIQRWQQ